MAIGAISFDLFDTLVDLFMDRLPEFELDGRRLRGTQALLHAAAGDFVEISLGELVGALAQVDREFREARYAQHLELPTLERFGELAARLGARQGFAERLTEVHMEALGGHVGVLEHHRDVLLALRQSGVRLGVCSNFSHAPTARRILLQAGLLDLLDAVVISEEAGFRKPRAEIFRATLSKLGSTPEATLHVGDQLAADLGGAAAVGMPGAWLLRRVRDPDARLAEHGGPPPAHVLLDLRELPDLLTRLG
jgi:putative hydrolase of the HAD superfamily